MSCRLSGSWSSSQAATPMGESAMPYSVWGCHPMKNWVGMALYKRASVAYACLSSAERPGVGGQFRVHADHFRISLRSDQVVDNRAPIPTLRHISRVPKALHQHRPGTRDARLVPAGRCRLPGKPVTRHRWDHHVEGVRRAAAMSRGVGQRIDDLQLFDDRARPSMGDDDRQRILFFRTDVNEMDVQPIDLGDELLIAIRVRPLAHLLPISLFCRSGRNADHSSWVRSVGCSHAAKWPPLSTLL